MAERKIEGIVTVLERLLLLVVYAFTMLIYLQPANRYQWIAHDGIGTSPQDDDSLSRLMMWAGMVGGARIGPGTTDGSDGGLYP